MRSHLGELEELVLLIVGVLYKEAYGVSVKKEIEKQTGRKLNISAVHSTLRRLEKKGMLQSQMGDPTALRGGRRKRLFTLTYLGKKAIDENRRTRNLLWQQIPKISFS